MSALAVAARDTRTPLAARLVVVVVVAYAISPIDLVPDFVPVLGLLDDLLLLPLGLALAIRLVPADVLADARSRVELADAAGWGRHAAVAVVLAWLVSAGLGIAWALGRLG